MRPLSTDLSLDAYWEDLTYLEAALHADPSTAPLAAPITAHLHTLDALHADDRASRRALIQARARVKRIDAHVDRAIRALHADVLALASGREAHPLYRAVFAYDLLDLIRYDLARQLQVTARMAQTLAASPDHAALAHRAQHLDALAALQADGAAVLKARDDAERLHATQRAHTLAWKDDANARRGAAYAALLDLQHHQNGSHAWARTFFQPPNAAADRPNLR